jgi:peptidoglycan glycosyltransferase
MSGAIRKVGYGLIALVLILVGQLTYLQVVDASRLANDPDNIRKFLRDFNRARGDILTADGQVVAKSVPTDGELEYQRVYPTGDLFSNISGYQSFVVGNTGVEASYNRVLTGRDRELDFDTILSGKENIGNVVLAQTMTAQQAARDALEGQKGSVVAIDVRTGAIAAMYSNPSFDPNPLADHEAKNVNFAFFILNADPNRPALARAYRERYPPGSTFKVVTATGAIDTGISPPDRQFPVSGGFPLPDTETTIRNFGNSTCGGGNLTQSLLQSCNATFAALGYELGPEHFPAVMDACGIGSAEAPIAPPLDLEPGAAGSVGPSGPVRPPYGLAGIGQGDVFVTPLEMALVAAGIANGGVIMAPHVAREVTNADGKVIETIDPQPWKTCTTPDTARSVTDMMVANVERGTGTRAQIPNVAVAGKTGTAQTELGAPHAWFIAFAPADNPRYAVSVLVENGGIAGDAATGGDLAAPVARQVLETLLAQP